MTARDDTKATVDVDRLKWARDRVYNDMMDAGDMCGEESSDAYHTLIEAADYLLLRAPVEAQAPLTPYEAETGRLDRDSREAQAPRAASDGTIPAYRCPECGGPCAVSGIDFYRCHDCGALIAEGNLHDAQPAPAPAASDIYKHTDKRKIITTPAPTASVTPDDYAHLSHEQLCQIVVDQKEALDELTVDDAAPAGVSAERVDYLLERLAKLPADLTVNIAVTELNEIGVIRPVINELAFCTAGELVSLLRGGRSEP